MSKNAHPQLGIGSTADIVYYRGGITIISKLFVVTSNAVYNETDFDLTAADFRSTATHFQLIIIFTICFLFLVGKSHNISVHFHLSVYNLFFQLAFVCILKAAIGNTRGYEDMDAQTCEIEAREQKQEREKPAGPQQEVQAAQALAEVHVPPEHPMDMAAR